MKYDVCPATSTRTSVASESSGVESVVAATTESGPAAALPCATPPPKLCCIRQSYTGFKRADASTDFAPAFSPAPINARSSIPAVLTDTASGPHDELLLGIEVPRGELEMFSAAIDHGVAPHAAARRIVRAAGRAVLQLGDHLHEERVAGAIQELARRGGLEVDDGLGVELGLLRAAADEAGEQCSEGERGTVGFGCWGRSWGARRGAWPRRAGWGRCLWPLRASSRAARSATRLARARSSAPRARCSVRPSPSPRSIAGQYSP